MKVYLINLLIGIIGGIYSGVIVSRVFLIREKLEEQIEVLRMTSYYFGTLMACFDMVESILKLSSDTSDEIKREINNDPNYLKTHDIIRTKDVIEMLKKELLDKTIEKICSYDNPLVLKQKNYISLQNKTRNTLEKYKSIKEFNFKTIDECKKEIGELETEYEKCLKTKGTVFLSLIVRDKIMIALFVVLIIICIVVITV